MSISHIALVILVTIIWGLNFIFVKTALDELSPFMLSALRFILASIPFVFFIKPPKINFLWVMLYGLIMFALQFTLLFFSMRAGMSPGLASIILQVQIFFSMFYAAVLWKELPSIWQIIGALISFIGIGLVATHLDNQITVTGFLLALAGAAAWGLGNVINKSIGQVNTMALVVWGSFTAAIPMILLCLSIDGVDAITASYHKLNYKGISSVLYIVYISTLIGYGSWSWLLNRYTVSAVVPFTLLIPIFGMLSAILILGEPFYAWKLWAGILVVGGLGVNLLGARLFVKK